MKNNRNSHFETVGFTTYLSAVNFFRNNGMSFKLTSNPRNGNKLWKTKENKVVAKRILCIPCKESDTDIYLIDKNIINKIKAKN